MKVQKYFNDYNEFYISLAKWAGNLDLLELTLYMLRDVPVGRVVDLGAGNGVLLSTLKDSQQRIAVDISVRMLLSIQDTHIEKVVGDIHCIPLRDRVADLVVCRQVLHYCDLYRALLEAKRIMTPDGFLHIVQLTDYDDVPASWYQYWMNLRGIGGRAHISHSALLESTSKAGYVLVAETSCHLHAESIPWHDFFAKNRVPSYREAEVKEFFRSTDQSISKRHELEVSEYGLSYVRRFSLLLFTLVREENK